MVSAGTYNLQTIVHVVNSGITIRGATGNRDDVILDAGGMGTGHTHGILIDVDADDVTIADLTIRNAGEHGISIQGSDRPTLYNLHIVDTGSQLVKVNPWGDGSEDGLLACSRLEYTTNAPDDYTNGISAHRAHRWVVRDNEWYRIRGPGSGYTGPTILFWSESTDTVVERNLLVDCYRGVAFGNPGQGGVNHSGGIVRNNFIYSSLEHDVAVEMTRAQDWLVANNTALLFNPASGLTWGVEVRYTESEGTFAYNLTNMTIINRDSAQGTLTGNVTNAQSNWFVDAAAGDLHLLSTATSAIDQAAPLAQVTDDFDGDMRPIGPAPDVGADEYGVPSSTATPTPTPTATVTPTATPTNPPCDLDGDLDGDGDVDIADIMLVASRWHTAAGDPDYNPDYDLDGNGVIDIVDIMLVAVHWGETCPPEGGARVWAVGNTRKVLPTDPAEGANYVWSGASRSVGIKAARNEHEPFQLIIA
ncbi:MAG: right-handed parallel beta-helix repeat-containing protein, partial [Anaerolineae bacterium]|nr:right-handed parallel beta-helix repeat-containing protein [Anaerolineae bacterium]